MKRLVGALCALVLGALASPQIATSATIVQTTEAMASWSDLTPFDSTLGALTSFTIETRARVRGEFGISDYNSMGSTHVVNFHVEGGGASAWFPSNGVGYIDTNDGFEILEDHTVVLTTEYYNQYHRFEVDRSHSYFETFSEAGDLEAITDGLLVYVMRPAHLGGTLTGIQSADWGFMVYELTYQQTLTYHYTPFAQPVPEPATWAMMIIGFGAVGTMVRASRRRLRVGT